MEEKAVVAVLAGPNSGMGVGDRTADATGVGVAEANQIGFGGKVGKRLFGKFGVGVEIKPASVWTGIAPKVSATGDGASAFRTPQADRSSARHAPMPRR